jgi:hypothetical protein
VVVAFVSGFNALIHFKGEFVHCGQVVTGHYVLIAIFWRPAAQNVLMIFHANIALAICCSLLIEAVQLVAAV